LEEVRSLAGDGTSALRLDRVLHEHETLSSGLVWSGLVWSGLV
jgi:hypothetical protein